VVVGCSVCLLGCFGWLLVILGGCRLFWVVVGCYVWFLGCFGRLLAFLGGYYVVLRS